jgi:hypothetical protein
LRRRCPADAEFDRPADRRSTSFGPDHVSAEANRLPDDETVETLYRLGERDRIVGIFGGCGRPPEARREKPQVSAFTLAVASAVCFIAVLGSGS